MLLEQVSFQCSDCLPYISITSKGKDHPKCKTVFGPALHFNIKRASSMIYSCGHASKQYAIKRYENWICLHQTVFTGTRVYQVKIYPSMNEQPVHSDMQSAALIPFYKGLV